jgi:hypothetical protein
MDSEEIAFGLGSADSSSHGKGGSRLQEVAATAQGEVGLNSEKGKGPRMNRCRLDEHDDIMLGNGGGILDGNLIACFDSHMVELQFSDAFGKGRTKAIIVTARISQADHKDETAWPTHHRTFPSKTFL